MRFLILTLTAALAAWGAPAAAGSAVKTTVFKSNFESGLPAGLDAGVGEVTGVQGYEGLAYGTRQFSGQMLRSPTGNVVTLTLQNLPAHRHLGVDFLFAAIDSLDGTGTFPSGDFFHVKVDGVSVFRESFANATESQVQSYTPSKPGFVLARRVDLGFSQGTYYLDSAYYLGGEKRLKRISHTGSSAVITFEIEGEGIQPLSDESWGMDALKVYVY